MKHVLTILAVLLLAMPAVAQNKAPEPQKWTLLNEYSWMQGGPNDDEVWIDVKAVRRVSFLDNLMGDGTVSLVGGVSSTTEGDTPISAAGGIELLEPIPGLDGKLDFVLSFLAGNQFKTDPDGDSDWGYILGPSLNFNMTKYLDFRLGAKAVKDRPGKVETWAITFGLGRVMDDLISQVF